MHKKRILITGSAGFIGHHLVLALRNSDFQIIGIDSLNDYYETNLKLDRLRIQGFNVNDIRYNGLISSDDNFAFIKLDLKDRSNIIELFQKYKFDYVINLAAQAGVRHSLTAPFDYVDSNLVGFVNILEACKAIQVKHLIFASSSSVYGLSKSIPFRTIDNTDYPISLYAATKKANEVLAHSYSHLYNIPCTALRFFTVYGPMGRPDMAYFSFTKAIKEGKPIQVFNYGDMMRDFTYIDDITTSIDRLIKHIPTSKLTSSQSSDFSNSHAPFVIYNIGNNNPVKISEFIETLEELLHVKAVIEYLPMQDGDVPITYADVSDLERTINYKPKVTIQDGLAQFVQWYNKYYN